jgi:hypothetical protein
MKKDGQEKAPGGNVEGMSYFEYAELIQNARIKGMGKALLWFYAYVYNWENQGRSFYEEFRVAAHVGFAVSAVQSWRKYLVDLGWLEVIPQNRRKPPFVGVRIGRDDPDFEGMSYARWRPTNKGLTPAELARLSKDELEFELAERARDRKRNLKDGSSEDLPCPRHETENFAEDSKSSPGEWDVA